MTNSNVNLKTASKTISDKTTPIDDLKKEVHQFINARDWDQFHTPKDLAIGLITEASELLEHFRFKNEAEVEDLLTDKQFQLDLQHELADCFYFILAISNKLEFDLSAVLLAKLAISAQKYPIAKAHGKNLKYTQLY